MKFRRGILTVLVALLSAGVVFAQPGGRRGAGGFAMGQRGMAPVRPAPEPRARQQEHLGRWFEKNGNLPLAEQQKALEKEPGFKDLPPETQQRLRNQITQLNQMTPDQRRRTLEDTEAMERLTPAQRQQFAGAMQSYGTLPKDRRKAVAKAFRNLREMPPQQREATMNSDRFRNQFSDQERGTLSSLLTLQPYIPSMRSPDPGK